MVSVYDSTVVVYPTTVVLYPYQTGVRTPSFLGTDKIEPHGYFTEYLRIAADIGPRGRICEIGVDHGESMKMWQGLFPIGEITGVDCNEGAVWPAGIVKVVKNQDDPSLAELGPFDLIVDDASHDGNLTRATFEIMWPRVKPGGYYVIEDWVVGLKEHLNHTEMLRTVQDLILLMPYRDSECDAVLFRYGMAIVHKRRR